MTAPAARVLDLETRSYADLKTVGAPRYSEDESTQVRTVTVAPAGNDSPPAVFDIDLHEVGGPEHAQVAASLHAATSYITQNGSFDRLFCRKLSALGFQVSDRPELWVQDTMPRATAAGLPGSLAALSSALGLGDFGKADSKGMALFTRPGRSGTIPNLRGHEKAAEFIEYARRDVIATRLVHRSVPLLTEFEQRVHAATIRMNDRGVGIDQELCSHALAAHEAATAPWADEFQALTGLAPTQTRKLLDWFRANGADIGSTDAESMAHLASTGSGEAQRAAALKETLGGTAIRKFATALQRVCADGRLHGEFRYYGAITGRWSSSGVQLQNMPRPVAPKDQIPVAIDLLSKGWIDVFLMMFDDPAGVLKSCVRGMLVGDKLHVADLSKVELVTLFCAAGCLATLRGDPYKDLASKLFGVAVDMVSSDQRTDAKPVVLGCGFGMRGNKLRATLSKSGTTVSEDWAHAAVAAYAQAFPDVPRLWAQLEEAAGACVVSGNPQPAGRAGARFEMIDAHLTMVYPSGRRIYYRNATATPGIRYGRTTLTITYDVPLHAGMARGDLQVSTLTENLASGMARDLLADAFVRADAAGLCPIALVHDEIIIESDRADAMAELVNIMTTPPAWAAALGIKLAAEGFSASRYRK